MGFWIGVGALCVVLFALTWWADRRSKGRGFRTTSDHEVAKGMGTLQGGTHNSPGDQGHHF